MSLISRRDFLVTSAVGLPVMAAMATRVEAASEDLFTLGSQSYSFRHFKFEESLQKLKELGLTHMEFCAAHFPPDAEDPGFSKIKAAIEASGIKVPRYGVEGFSEDTAANRKKFEFAKALGITVLTANPAPESFDNLEKLCVEFGVGIAIHNHGPDADYDKVADTLKAVEKRIPAIGACVDTGHVIRSGEKPHEVITALGKRVLSLHLKDWKQGGEEQLIGEGDMDLVAVVKALKAIHFRGPIMLEYENNPENPVPDMKKSLVNWRAACAKA
jgi:sugar phosphate isomerase/epimerase